MKRYIYLIAFALLAVTGTACKTDEPDDSKTGSYSFSVTEMTIDYTGGYATTTLTTDNGAWTLTQNSGTDWCKATPTSGPGSTTITFTAETNTGVERTATYTFNTSGLDPTTLTVTQGPDVLNTFSGHAVVANAKEWDGVKRAKITYQSLIYSFYDSDGDNIGDFNGITQKLDYLDQLGVSAIWLSPIHPSSSYHGYDIQDYYSVNSDLGTEDDLQSLINAAKEHGIKIYLDYVLNHSASEHPWFIDAKTNREDSQYWDYYAFSDDPATDIAAGKIAQIATEGASGYDSGQWFSTEADAGAQGYYKFYLDWTSSSSPTVTVTEASASDVDKGSNPATDKFLYYGNDICVAFNKTSTSNIYEITLYLDTDWGFLIRTSSTVWTAGTKYGAANNSDIITLGVPFTLHVSTTSFDPANIQFSKPLQFHSHLWTNWFADFNYGAADEAEKSGAFQDLAESGDKWINMGVAGFRLDAVKHIYHNANSNENPTFLKKWYDRMNETYKATGADDEFYMVGEQMSEPNEVAPYYAGIPALFEFAFWYRLSWALNNETGCYFADNITSYQPLYAAYRSDYVEPTKLSNHDENRAAEDLGRDSNRIRLACTVLLTAGGQPYIYQGEELGYWGSKDSGDENVRTPILWDKAKSKLATGYVSGNNSMLTSDISVEAQEADESSLLNLYRSFAQLRNTYPALAYGTMKVHNYYNDNTDYTPIAAWYLNSSDGNALVVHNFGGENLLLQDLGEDLSNPIALMGTAQVSDDNSLLLIGPYSSVVFDLD
ncbi:MAG: alpha-amylase [Bacteroidales bacterium]|nr:alpha-amylase [Bacteroidales bacterium]